MLANNGFIRPFSAVLIVVVICGTVAGAQPAEAPNVPDPSIMLALVPAAATAGPPPVIKPGTRLVYFGASASVPGERQQFVLDDNGNWVSKTTGQKFSAQDVSGAAGAGHNVVHVGYVDRNVVQLSSRLYVIDPASGTSMYSSGGGLVAHAGCAADYWIHPDILGNVQEVNQGGVRIVRMPYTVNNRRYNAIRFQNDGEQGYSAYVYDLETGLLVFHGSSAQGAAVLTPPVGGSGQVGVGRGSTQLVTGWLMEVKQIDIPWKQGATPPWMGQFRELRYQGALGTGIPGSPAVQRPMVISVTPKARGENWLRFASAGSIQSIGGLPPEQTQSDGSCGPATIGGLWIAPEALAGLRQGQVVETNDITRTTTTVTQTAGGRVTITETGPRHRLDFAYDTGSGILSALAVTQQIGIGTMVVQLQLAGKQ